MEKVTVDSGIAFQKAKSVRFPKLLLPPFLQTVSQPSLKLRRHRIGLTRFVQSDTLAIRETNRSAGTTPRLTESLKNRPPFFLKKGPLSEVFRLESCDASVDSR
jgi:hypothetical protein